MKLRFHQFFIIIIFTITVLLSILIDATSIKNNNTISIAFPRWDRTKSKFPCVDSNAPETEGIFYIKVPKTSSSTLAEITSRISGREAIRQKKSESCKIVHDPMVHRRCFELNCSQRDKNNSFLWTIVRHPKDRSISHFGMFYSQSRITATDESFIDTLENHGSFSRNIQLEYLNPFHDPKLPIPSNYNELLSLVESTVSEYNFIGTYERLEESLVVLSMILGVSVQDVLFDYKDNSRCGSTEKPSWLTDVMEGYLDSSYWMDHEIGDFMLYDAVNRSLDFTIEQLGRETVMNRLGIFRRLIEIGSGIVKDEGCGIPKLHAKHYPLANIEELPWFTQLPIEDQLFVKFHGSS